MDDTDRLLDRAVANCASAFVSWSQAMGRPFERHDDLWLCDLGLAEPRTPNGAFLLRPMSEADAEETVGRVTRFFADSPGGGYELWSPWPTPDASAFGFTSSSCPAMLREAGGAQPAAPAELQIVEATDEATLREAEPVLTAAMDMAPVDPGSVFGRGLLETGALRVWLGRVDGRAVTTAAAHVSDGFVGVYAVGTREEARGHGYGEAVTWAATLSRPDLPATLQASEMGFPLYERMGYRTLGQFTVWERPDR